MGQTCTETLSLIRQISADSGIEADCSVSLFNSPAILISYGESESWVHLETTTEPLAASQNCREDDILGLAVSDGRTQPSDHQGHHEALQDVHQPLHFCGQPRPFHLFTSIRLLLFVDMKES